MSKTATKASDNLYYLARIEASKDRPEFASRESTSDIIGIDRTRLARIELGTIVPYPDEVKTMAREYNSPELHNYFCSKDCPIGAGLVKRVELDSFDRLSLKVLGSLKNVNDLRDSLIAISEDGQVDESERGNFLEILDALDRIAETAQALSTWARKNFILK